MGVLGHFAPWDIFRLEVLGHFGSKIQTRKIVKIRTVFIYKVYIIYIIYILLTKVIETFWSRDVINIGVLAHFESKTHKDF